MTASTLVPQSNRWSSSRSEQRTRRQSWPKLRRLFQRSRQGVTFSFLCQLSEKYGTFIARCNALIEKVSPCYKATRNDSERKLHELEAVLAKVAGRNRQLQTQLNVAGNADGGMRVTGGQSVATSKSPAADGSNDDPADTEHRTAELEELRRRLRDAEVGQRAAEARAAEVYS
eukprot:SAG31_NODE_2235_length_6123_cov_2.723274_8_plen_173_part_00